MTSPLTLGIAAGALVAAAALCARPVAAQEEPAPTNAPADAPAEAAPDAPAIDWLPSYTDALARASAEKKPILLYFHSPG